MKKYSQAKKTGTKGGATVAANKTMAMAYQSTYISSSTELRGGGASAAKKSKGKGVTISNPFSLNVV